VKQAAKGGVIATCRLRRINTAAAQSMLMTSPAAGGIVGKFAQPNVLAKPLHQYLSASTCNRQICARVGGFTALQLAALPFPDGGFDDTIL
jgi:hypothetical protein